MLRVEDVTLELEREDVVTLSDDVGLNGTTP